MLAHTCAGQIASQLPIFCGVLVVPSRDHLVGIFLIVGQFLQQNSPREYVERLPDGTALPQLRVLESNHFQGWVCQGTYDGQAGREGSEPLTK